MKPVRVFLTYMVMMLVTIVTGANTTCPGSIPCICTKRRNPDTGRMEKVVDCQNKKFTETPSFLKFANEKYDALLLNNNRLTTLIRGAFQGLGVTRIDLSNNPDLISFSNYAFDGIPGLKVLVIENGRLTSVPVAVSKLSNLQELRLRNNMIRALPTKAFESMKDLKYLDLANNRAEFTRPFHSFKPLTSLEHLDLEQNGLYNLPTEALETTLKLKTLVLSDNKIREASLDVLKSLKHLKRLELKGNPLILDKPEKGLFPGLNLEMFSIGGCDTPIPEVTPHTLATLRNVRNLTIRECQVKTIPQGTFKTLPHLQYLDISGNPIKATPELFYGVEGKLTTLKLDKMGFKAYPAKLLARFPRLSDISLNNNNISFLPGGIFKLLPFKGSRISITNSSIVKVSKHVMDGVNSPASLLLANNKIRSLAFISRHPCRFYNTYVDLSNNPIHCNCNTYRMVQHKIFELVGKCHTPRHHHGLELIWRPERDDVQHFEMSTNATDECAEEPRHKEKYDCACKTWQDYNSPRLCAVVGGASQFCSSLTILLAIVGSIIFFSW